MKKVLDMFSVLWVLVRTYITKKVIFGVLCILLIVFLGYIAYAFKYNNLNYYGELQPLRIPELIDTRTAQQPIIITAQKSEHQFVPGVISNTLGYNGSYLGPTIKMYKGETTKLSFVNEIGEETNVHGHGLHVSGDIDGGEMTIIHEGETRDIEIPIVQEASTNWYHPHLMGTTGKQVHGGLAGFYLIEDENSQSLGLPNTYGVDDIPLVIQDRDFKDGKMLPYPERKSEDKGRQSTFVVNGTLNPELKVPAGLIRLRLLNGANARPYKFFLQKKKPFYKIATEGGFLESPVEITSLIMAPGERNEIIVDMSNEDSLALIGKFLETENFITDYLSPRGRVLQLTVDASIDNAPSILPKKTNEISRYNERNVEVERNFRLEDMRINGKRMSMNMINHEARLGELEKRNVISSDHPFHMHGTSFQILSINGKQPPPEQRGRKDTIYNRGRTELLMKFNHTAPKATPYMYHCHILEHEDMGMMGQFTVE